MKDMRLIYLFMTMVVVYGIGMTFFMDTLGFTFGIMGMSLGTMGFIFGLICLKELKNLQSNSKKKKFSNKTTNLNRRYLIERFLFGAGKIRLRRD